MLTAKQHELLHFIQQRLDASGISPSFEEMKEALGLKSKSGIHRLISALEERGFLRRLPNRARALEVMRLPTRYKEVLLLYYYQNMTMQEIATALSIAQSSVSSRLARARDLLRRALERRPLNG